jgi:hypothetical protein
MTRRYVFGFSVAARAAALALALGAATAVQGASVILKIRAINPSQTEKQKVEVKAFLPKPAKADDVIKAGGLETSYDVHEQAYLVHKSDELDPKEVRTYEVELRDIWLIPEVTLNDLQAHAVGLADALKGTEQGATAAEIRATVKEALAAVRERQRAYDVTLVKAIEHIRAYEANQDRLNQIRKDIAMLENLAIAAGKDPEKILGTSATAPASEPASASTGEVVTIRIQVTNPSLTTKAVIPVKRELPFEVKATDVVDAGGLEIGYDPARGVCYAYTEKLEMAPQETKSFEIKVRNRWAGILSRTAVLESRTTNLQAVARRTSAYKSIEDMSQSILRDLAQLKEEKGPAVLNEDYVAFHRQQAERLNAIEGRVLRLEEMFQPRQRPLRFIAPVLTLQPPSAKTTWIIIWTIIGFLFVLSLLFFLRWYGKTKAEQMNKLSGEGRTPAAKDQAPTDRTDGGARPA